MFCKKCGTEVSNDMDFCPNCGEKIDKMSSRSNDSSTVPGVPGNSRPMSLKAGLQENEVIGVIVHFLTAVSFLFAWYDMPFASVNVFKAFKAINTYGGFFEYAGDEGASELNFLKALLVLGIIAFIAELLVGIYMLLRHEFKKKPSVITFIITMIITIILIIMGLLIRTAVKQEIGSGVFTVTFAPYLAVIICIFGIWWDKKKISH